MSNRRQAFALAPLAPLDVVVSGYKESVSGGGGGGARVVDLSDAAAGHRFDYANFTDSTQTYFYAKLENAINEAVLTANVSEAEQQGLLNDGGGKDGGKEGGEEQQGQGQEKGVRDRKKPASLLPHNKGTHTLFLHPSLLGMGGDEGGSGGGGGGVASPSHSQSAPNSARLDPLGDRGQGSLYRLNGDGGDLDALALLRSTHAPRSELRGVVWYVCVYVCVGGGSCGNVAYECDV